MRHVFVGRERAHRMAHDAKQYVRALYSEPQVRVRGPCAPCDCAGALTACGLARPPGASQMARRAADRLLYLVQQHRLSTAAA